jgi:hypothetical protein
LIVKQILVKDIEISQRGQIIKFKRKKNKETQIMESIEYCKNFKNILIGSNKCVSCKYFGGKNECRIRCYINGKLIKVFTP